MAWSAYESSNGFVAPADMPTHMRIALHSDQILEIRYSGACVYG